MTDERWQELIGQIKDSLEILDHYTKDLPEEAGQGSVEVIEFQSPMGKMKLERTTQPLLLDKKTYGSKRMGSQADVKYIYSETEKTHKFKAYKYDSNTDDWTEIQLERGLMSF